MIDPRHPLYGQSFEVCSLSKHSRIKGTLVRVRYQKKLNLFIPLAVTNLSTYNALKRQHKFTVEALEEFVAVAEELSIDVYNLSGKNLVDVNRGNSRGDHLRPHSNPPGGDK